MIEKPILLEIPEELETERLYLRAPRLGQGKIIHEAAAESLDALSRWMPWAANGLSLEEAETFVRESLAHFVRREEFNYLIWRKSDECFAGLTGTFRLDWTIPSCEIGYWLRTSFVGQGYVSEAVESLTHFLYDDLNMQRIEIRCDALNRRSAAVAERAGFTLEAHLHHDRRDNDGNLADTLIYGKLAGDQ